jgi:hypothetical protein
MLTPLGTLAVLFPLGLYCLILSRLNRAAHPVLVPGAVDFAGLLFGISGLILYGGPCLLTGFHYGADDLWLHLRFQSLRGHGDRSWHLWLAMLGCYFMLVLAVSILVLYYRRRTTAIYHVSPQALREALTQAAARQGLDASWSGDRLRLRQTCWAGALSRHDAEGMEDSLPGATRVLDGISNHVGSLGNHVASANSAPETVVQMFPFPVLQHATLRWVADTSGLRADIEQALGRIFAQVETRNQSVGLWLLAIGVFLMTSIFLALLFFAFLLFRELFRAL